MCNADKLRSTRNVNPQYGPVCAGVLPPRQCRSVDPCALEKRRDIPKAEHAEQDRARLGEPVGAGRWGRRMMAYSMIPAASMIAMTISQARMVFADALSSRFSSSENGIYLSCSGEIAASMDVPPYGCRGFDDAREMEAAYSMSAPTTQATIRAASVQMAARPTIKSRFRL